MQKVLPSTSNDSCRDKEAKLLYLPNPRREKRLSNWKRDRTKRDKASERQTETEREKAHEHTLGYSASTLALLPNPMLNPEV